MGVRVNGDLGYVPKTKSGLIERLIKLGIRKIDGKPLRQVPKARLRAVCCRVTADKMRQRDRRQRSRCSFQQLTLTLQY